MKVFMLIFIIFLHSGKRFNCWKKIWGKLFEKMIRESEMDATLIIQFDGFMSSMIVDIDKNGLYYWLFLFCVFFYSKTLNGQKISEIVILISIKMIQNKMLKKFSFASSTHRENLSKIVLAKTFAPQQLENNNTKKHLFLLGHCSKPLVLLEL